MHIFFKNNPPSYKIEDSSSAIQMGTPRSIFNGSSINESMMSPSQANPSIENSLSGNA